MTALVYLSDQHTYLAYLIHHIAISNDEEKECKQCTKLCDADKVRTAAVEFGKSSSQELLQTFLLGARVYSDSPHG